MIAVCCDLVFAGPHDRYAVLAHQPANTAVAHIQTNLLQLFGHSWPTIAAQAETRLLFDMGQRASNNALANIGPKIQWQHSYVAGEKTFCVYLAESEDEIRKHSEQSGIPYAKITEEPQIIDPLTTNN